MLIFSMKNLQTLLRKSLQIAIFKYFLLFFTSERIKIQRRDRDTRKLQLRRNQNPHCD